MTIFIKGDPDDICLNHVNFKKIKSHIVYYNPIAVFEDFH